MQKNYSFNMIHDDLLDKDTHINTDTHLHHVKQIHFYS